ncbi:unnamed protein product [Zymoseptoria tritici ST99CH_3D7]|uniref:Uncharacterized protein n=1 Tax=Zymoseptoria tritici (strain ST99CH_3D7) TaxID=1276538 RepID=A0A1X7RWN8_ZYMT9|nr:unnamed protein product [Zymoseptoria tritici ST99CH_3D7]
MDSEIQYLSVRQPAGRHLPAQRCSVGGDAALVYCIKKRSIAAWNDFSQANSITTSIHHNHITNSINIIKMKNRHRLKKENPSPSVSRSVKSVTKNAASASTGSRTARQTQAQSAESVAEVLDLATRLIVSAGGCEPLSCGQADS